MTLKTIKQKCTEEVWVDEGMGEGLLKNEFDLNVARGYRMWLRGQETRTEWIKVARKGAKMF